MSIPPDISKVLLSQDDLNVVDLVDFTISKGTKSAPDLLVMQDSELFSKIASVITSEKHVAFLHSLAIPTAMQVRLLQEKLKALPSLNPLIHKTTMTFRWNFSSFFYSFLLISVNYVQKLNM